jgi:endo-1,4-beta-xylanase
MDASGAATANGTQIIQWTYDSSANQQWTVTTTNGYYKIIGVQSGRSLDIYNGNSGNGTKVELWDYSNGPGQQWNLIPTDSGNYRITPNCATGSCLDVYGASTANNGIVNLWQWNGGANQKWSFQAP